MCYIKSILQNSDLQDYYVDVEYNRNDGEVKTIINDNFKVVRVTCDLIIHSRGEIIDQDNLLALEMKKSTRLNKEKIDDKERLIALTKSSYDENTWSADGKTLPEHVCGYLIGIYYEINVMRRELYIEHYIKGKKVRKSTLAI